MAGTVSEVTDTNFQAEVLESEVPVLVDFWAPWCGPCRMVSPLVERVGREHAGQLKVVKLNIDEAPEISDRYAVRGIPLLVIENALVLAAARRIFRPPNAPALQPVRSLYYMMPVVNEVLQLHVSQDYYRYLRFRIDQALSNNQPR